VNARLWIHSLMTACVPIVFLAPAGAMEQVSTFVMTDYPTTVNQGTARNNPKSTEAAEPVRRQSFVRASVQTGKASQCVECTSDFVASIGAANQPPQSLRSPDRSGVPQEAVLVGQSSDGSVAVYAIDTPRTLALLFKHGNVVNKLFENDRRPTDGAAE